jgi:phosphatidylethanolamine-binding protein (PEBP) family uncharacterized protein
MLRTNRPQQRFPQPHAKQLPKTDRVSEYCSSMARALSADRADLLKAIEGHVLAEGRLAGKYARDPEE